MSLMGLIAIAIVVIIMLIVIIASINFVMNENMKEKAAEEEKNKTISGATPMNMPNM